MADASGLATSSCPALYRVSTIILAQGKDVDGRDKPGDDEKQRR
jgi:hypothetical protein